jgi:hypothetical protein
MLFLSRKLPLFKKSGGVIILLAADGEIEGCGVT